MNTELTASSLAALQASILKHAQKILPHYAPYGIHLLEGSEAIEAWAQSHDWPTEALPSHRIEWAVGIDRCAHRQVTAGIGYADPSQVRPGLFSVSKNARTMEWRPGKNRPIRIGGSAPIRMPIEFIFWITANNGLPEAPASPDTFKNFSDEELDSWTIAQANKWQ